MSKLISSIVAAVAIVFSGLAVAPVSADTSSHTYVDAFVVPDPSLDGCSMGNSIKIAGNLEKIQWEIDGRAISFSSPQAAQLFYPEGFSGTLRATSLIAGVDLLELSSGRSGESLEWELVVTPTADDCARVEQARSECEPVVEHDTRVEHVVEQLTVVDTQRVDELTVELAVANAKIERQRTIINRLREKLRRR